MSSAEAGTSRRSVPPIVDGLSAWGWRLLVIGATGLAAVLVIVRLRVVLVPVVIAFLLATFLVPPARWLMGRGLPPLLAAWIVMASLLAGGVALGSVIVTPLVAELDDLDVTLEQAIDEIELWLVDGPLDLDRSQVEDARERWSDAVRNVVASDGRLVDGAVVIGQSIAGLVLALVIAFFFVKDGEHMQRAALRFVPTKHHERVRRMAGAAWSTLGRYLLGAAALGFVESIIMGTTLVLVGADVVLPIVALTFAAAFFPFVGAIVAGLAATAVTLVAGGPEAAAIVAGVALLIQQFDNELLAPVIYSRALRMHPLVVIVSVATGAALGGLVGAVIAVPLVAVVQSSYVADQQLQAGADLPVEA